MRRVSLFAEDYGHEAFLCPLLDRLAGQYNVPVTVRRLSVRGGYGTVVEELGEYVSDLMAYRENLPDLLLVATDANCQGFARRRKQFQETIEPVRDQVVLAVPDPHVERWLLLDSAAFKHVLGKSCHAPDQKCDRDRYKKLLAQAVADSGVKPLFGGMEHAEHIVRVMDLEAIQKQGESLGELLEELHSRFRMWKGGGAD
jgi:hypothetical protein